MKLADLAQNTHQQRLAQMGPGYWAELHAWADRFKAEVGDGCGCGGLAVAATHALHDAVNVSLQKPVKHRAELRQVAVFFQQAVGASRFSQPMLHCAPEFYCHDVEQVILGVPVWDIITEKVLAAMRSGTVPWVRPWSRQAVPRNAVSNRPYSGINLFLLAMSGTYSDPRWLTFKQAQDLGGNIRRGEKSTVIIFWKILDRPDPDDPDETTHFALLRYYNVFNVEQAERLTKLKPLPALPTRPVPPVEAADKIVAGMPNPPMIDHKGGDRAFYRPDEDAIHLPPRSSFSGPDEFYSTLFHELAHSTGHKSRLNRLEESFVFGDPVYSREELVAEFGSAYLSAEAGIDSVIPNQAAYLRGWIKALSNDPKLLIVAASRGQKATRYILGELEAEDVDALESQKATALVAAPLRYPAALAQVTALFQGAAQQSNLPLPVLDAILETPKEMQRLAGELRRASENLRPGRCRRELEEAGRYLRDGAIVMGRSLRASCAVHSQQELQQSKFPLCSPAQRVRLEACIQRVKERGSSVNPFAVCQSSLGCRKGPRMSASLLEYLLHSAAGAGAATAAATLVSRVMGGGVLAVTSPEAVLRVVDDRERQSKPRVHNPKTVEGDQAEVDLGSLLAEIDAILTTPGKMGEVDPQTFQVVREGA